MIKSLFNVFNRNQAESKRRIALEKRRTALLLAELEGATGLTNIFDKIESNKKDWKKEDEREEAIKSFLDL